MSASRGEEGFPFEEAPSKLRHGGSKPFPNLPVRLDVKNEARGHLWYEQKFGSPIATYLSTADAITTFPTTATAIGIRPKGDEFEFEAPFGSADLMQGIVRPNRKQITKNIQEAKVRRWIDLWPELTVIDW